MLDRFENPTSMEAMTEEKTEEIGEKSAAIDIEPIMERVRASARRKKAAVGIEGRSPGEQLELLRRCSDVRSGYEISSHRPVLGAVIVFFKRVLNFIIRRSASPILDRNAEFNSRLVTLLAGFVSELDALRRQVATLEKKFQPRARNPESEGESEGEGEGEVKRPVSSVSTPSKRR